MKVPVPRVELASGYSVARVVTGGWQLTPDHGGGPDLGDRDQLFARLHRRVELGFTTFDCADIYTGVEGLLGEFVATLPDPSNVQIHTKYVPDLRTLTGLTPRDVEAAVDRSLKRLRCDRLDLVQFHWWDLKVPGYLEALESLDRLRRAGKIRCLGLTNFGLEALQQIAATGIPVVAHQVQYSLLDRRPEHGVADFCRKHGIALLAYGTLAGGLLSKRWQGRHAPGGAGNRSHAKYELMVEEFGGWEELQSLLAELDELGTPLGLNPAQVAMRWVLERPGVAAVLVGLGRRPRIHEIQAALSASWDHVDQANVAALLLDRPGPPGDVYELERVDGGAHQALLRTGLNADSVTPDRRHEAADPASLASTAEAVPERRNPDQFDLWTDSDDTAEDA